MKKSSVIGLFLSMILSGTIYGLSFHITVMHLFSSELIHCIIMGLLFGLLNFVIAFNFLKKYCTLKTRNASLNSKVEFDQLTQLLNRRAFERYLETLDNSSLISVIFIDIDNFRNFNNLFGHQIGDEVLVRVSNTIQSTVRCEDKIFRYGGEEIVIILGNCTKDKARAIGDKIRSNIYQLDNSPFPKITVSLGVACNMTDGNTIKDTVAAADKALLAAKANGKNCIMDYSVQVS